jgi:hypothetical protein
MSVPTDGASVLGEPQTSLAEIHRRPLGAPPPLPKEAGWLQWAVVFCAVLVIGVVLEVGLRTSNGIQSFDQDVLRWFSDRRTDGFTNVATALYLPAGLALVLIVRLVVVAVLAAFGRFRHMVVFLATFVISDWLVARALFVPLPRPSVPMLIGPRDYAFPSQAIAPVVVTLMAMAFVLVPRGPARRWVRVAAHLFVAFEVVLGLYLGADYLVPMLYAWLLATTVAQLTFRWLVPEDVFPVTYRRGGKAAHLDLGGARGDAIVNAMREQLGLVVTLVEPFGLEGSGGSSPLRMTLLDGTRTFGKIYSTSHVRADRWYRIGRTILYGQLEDETPIGSVRRLVILEDYALRFLRDGGVRVARSFGIVELTPNAEYMLVTEFFENSKTLGESDVDDIVIDEGLDLIRRLWELGVAHRDIKPANLLVKDGHLQLVDVSGLEIRPSPWRQAVDLANMMLTLALQSDADRVYARAIRVFTPEEVAEAMACAVGLAIPTQLQERLGADPRPLLARFKELAPSRTPISIQRWDYRRLVTTAVAAAAVLLLIGLFADAVGAGIN